VNRAARILLVDDEVAIQRAVAPLLRSRGYDVDVVGTGLEAVNAVADHAPDLIVLDLGLPDLEGAEVCRRIRKQSKAPIVVLSARAEEADKVAALDLGADDYVTKPFGLAELRSRIRAVLRRAGPRGLGNELLAVGDVTLDRAHRAVHVRNEEVALTFSEFELLDCLMSHPGRAFNRMELLRAIWGESAYRDPRAIDVHVRHLRAKLEAEPSRPYLIVTVRGAGYRLNAA
jgi:DNA-binding response OmpR family regulator